MSRSEYSSMLTGWQNTQPTTTSYSSRLDEDTTAYTGVTSSAR